MKKRIIIPKEHIEYEQISGAGFDTIKFHLGTDKTLEVPESWEDVKQLTKEHIDKLKLNKDVWEIDIQKDFIDIQKKYVTYRVRVTNIGNILFDAYLKIAENKTPNELWSFIKSLIGEE